MRITFKLQFPEPLALGNIKSFFMEKYESMKFSVLFVAGNEKI